MKTITAGLLLWAAALAGCSSTTEPTPSTSSTSGTNGSSGSSGTSGSSGETTSGGTTSGDPAPATPKAPTIDMIMKMTGGLHVMWSNTEKSCETIEGERKAEKSDGTVVAPYAVAFTVPGEADNKHDAKATEALKYTYRLRCKKAGVYSTYSNEMSGSPQ